MEALGQLTGGVAHDFNNLLQIVMGNLETLTRALPAELNRLRRAADNAMTGARRAATLTQRLLAFSRRQPLDPKPIDANALVEGMSDLLGRAIGETIALETHLAPDLWWTEADPHQLESAILNLVVNARDAMTGGGKLTIETANVWLDEAYAEANLEVMPGPYVSLSVTDNGAGIDKTMMGRVFEPFFTTKEVGKGTGLGLAMVYGFVKQSGGHVKLYSELGDGTSVKIYLPRRNGSGAVPDAPSNIGAPRSAGCETILVVEDDADVRSYSIELLHELGYRVLEAQDAASALAVLAKPEADQIALLFTDVVLPGGMTGADLARQALIMRPTLKVLFTTGYARDAIVHQGRLDEGVDLITKPFTYADLAAKLRDALDGTK
jgi:CheY-like chemotaxis protein